ncbi:MAG: hypothetical protein IPH43_15000 [Xanthomonadales bacterium]|nr:hypothetical protein [Xanthomonadales bacterium]
MRNNRGGDGMRATGEFATVSMKDCLLAGNQFSRQLMRTEGEYSLAYILGCTIAGNPINSTDLFHIEHRLALNETIIDQPGNLTLAFSGIPEGLNVASVLASDISTLPLIPPSSLAIHRSSTPRMATTTCASIRWRWILPRR